jgi:hypothetical protein
VNQTTGEIGDAFKGMGDDAEEGNKAVVVSTADMVEQVVGEAQTLIDDYFGAIHAEEERHDARLALLAAQESARKAKTKKEAQAAARAMIAALEDEGGALLELADKGKLTQKDVDTFQKVGNVVLTV